MPKEMKPTEPCVREQFEAALIARFKESGFLEVEIRVECLGRSGDGYQDSSVDAYWHFWLASREAVVIALPPKWSDATHSNMQAWDCGIEDARMAIEAQGLKVVQ